MLPDAQYFALTLTATPKGAITWSAQSFWVGPGSKRMWEMRAPCLVDGAVMRRVWEDLGEGCIVVNNLRAFAFFMTAGGNALVARKLAERWLPTVLEPVECVPGPMGAGARTKAQVPAAAFSHAPTKKLRMDALRRDDFRCRVCGRRAADEVDIVLHAHHIKPFGDGGTTELDNLITLCHTCHIGLDPHFELRLSGMIPGGVPMIDVDIERDREAHTAGVRRYRELVRRLRAGSDPAR